jgi:hypothetical protein
MAVYYVKRVKRIKKYVKNKYFSRSHLVAHIATTRIYGLINNIVFGDINVVSASTQNRRSRLQILLTLLKHPSFNVT